MTRSIRVALGALLVALSPVAAVAQPAPNPGAEATWTLTTADLKTEPVSLVGIAATGLKVSASAGGTDARDVPMDRFVQVSRNVPNAPREGKFDLHLVGGDRLNGEPVKIENDETLVWKNPVAGEVGVPLRLLAGLGKAGAPLNLERRKDDLVTLDNGDQLNGTIADVTPEKLTVAVSGGGIRSVPFPKTVSVVFAATAQLGRDKPWFRVRLDEGSAVAGSAVTLAGDKLKLTIGTKDRELPLARVAAVEQVNGPVSFLANRNPSANVFTPYLGNNQRFVARMHADFEGDPIRFRDRVYPRSIATHAYSKLTWPLDGTYSAFRTRYAIDPKVAGGSGADVTVRVKLDDKVVHEQANVRPGVLSAPVSIDLGSAKSITLEVDYGRQLDSNDRLNWLEPALLRFKPAE